MRIGTSARSSDASRSGRPRARAGADQSVPVIASNTAPGWENAFGGREGSSTNLYSGNKNYMSAERFVTDGEPR